MTPSLESTRGRAAPNAPRLLAMPELVQMISASRGSIYLWIAAGTFPRPIRIGPRRVAWELDAIHRWLEEQRAAA